MKQKKTEKKQSKKMSTIKFRPELFWDVDVKTIDREKDATYIIERVLELGKDSEARWVWNTYPRARIHDIAQHSRALRPETRALWTALTKK